jgi:hypothetical protein
MPVAHVEIPKDMEDEEVANQDDPGNYWDVTGGYIPGLSTFNAKVA